MTVTVYFKYGHAIQYDPKQPPGLIELHYERWVHTLATATLLARQELEWRGRAVDHD